MRRKISEIADVRAGYPFRGRVTPDPGGNARVVQIRDLDAAGLVRLDQLVPVKAANLDSYRLRQGDVLFLARGERRFAIPIPEQVDGLIAASYFFILRPVPDILPEYLVWAINQPNFQEAMRAFVKGSTLPQITKTDLLDVPIEIPSMVTQQRIVVVHELMDRERLLSNELNEKRSALLRAIASGSTHSPKRASS